jgi:hypothetical protein
MSHRSAVTAELQALIRKAANRRRDGQDGLRDHAERTAHQVRQLERPSFRSRPDRYTAARTVSSSPAGRCRSYARKQPFVQVLVGRARTEREPSTDDRSRPSSR